MLRENQKKIHISFLYDYIYGNKAQGTIKHLASKKTKKPALILQCDLMLLSASLQSQSLSHLIKPTYILSPEELYYFEPTSSESLSVTQDQKKIMQLWKELTGKNHPVEKSAQVLSPKQQRIITTYTKHTSEKFTAETSVFTKKFSKSAEQIEIQIQIDKDQEKKQKINDFSTILCDEKLLLDFRLFLRKINSFHLETLLFKNNTDDLTHLSLAPEYIFPSDDEIRMIFNEMNVEYHIFSDDKQIAVQKQFVIFFKIFKIIADFFEKNNDAKNSVAAEHAYKSLVLFGFNQNGNPFNRVEAYLKTHQCYHQLNPIHDTLARNSLPKLNGRNDNVIKDMNGWQAFIKEFGANAINYFQLACVIEKELKRAPYDMNEAKMAKAKWNFKNYESYPEHADICMQYNLSEQIYNTCLDIEQERKTSDNLPDVLVDGKTLGHQGYYLTKLPINDPRAYVLGHITNCCQSIGSHAQRCVYDGMTLKNNGFYVLLKGNSKQPVIRDKKINSQYKIIGQGYAWLSREKHTLVFDSWENLREEDNKIIVPLLTEFAKNITRESGILRVLIGQGGKTPEAFKKSRILPLPERMLEGYQYRDSLLQSEIYLNPLKILEICNELIAQWMSMEIKPFAMDWKEFCEFVLLNDMVELLQHQLIKKLFFNINQDGLSNVLDKEILSQLKAKSAVFRFAIFKLIDVLNEYDIFNNNNFKFISIALEDYISWNQDEFLEIIKILYDKANFLANLLTELQKTSALSDEIYNVVMDNVKQLDLTVCESLIELNRENLATIDNLKLFFKAHYSVKFAEGLIKLNQASILTEDTRQILFLASYNAYEAARILIDLKNSEKITDNDIKLLISSGSASILWERSQSSKPYMDSVPSFVILLRKLNQAGILSENSVSALHYHNINYDNEDADQIVDCFIALHQAGLFSEDNRKLIPMSPYRKEITNYFIALHKTGLYLPETRQAVIDNPYAYSPIADCFIKLHQADLWCDENRQLITKNINDCSAIVKSLVELKEAGIMSDNIRQIINEVPQFSHAMTTVLINLSREGILTTEYTNLLTQYKKMEVYNVACSLLKLKIKNLFHQGYINLILQNPWKACDLASSLTRLNKSGILTDEYIKLIRVNSSYCLVIAHCLTNLKAAGILNDEICKMHILAENKKDIFLCISELCRAEILSTNEDYQTLISLWDISFVTKGLTELEKTEIENNKQFQEKMLTDIKSNVCLAVHRLYELKELTNENYQKLISLIPFFVKEEINKQLNQKNEIVNDSSSSVTEEDTLTSGAEDESSMSFNEHHEEKEEVVKLFENEIKRLRLAENNIFHWGGGVIKITAYKKLIDAIKSSEPSASVNTILEAVKYTHVQNDKGKMIWCENEYIEMPDSKMKMAINGNAITIEDALMWRRNKLSFFSSDSAKVWKVVCEKYQSGVKKCLDMRNPR